MVFYLKLIAILLWFITCTALILLATPVLIFGYNLLRFWTMLAAWGILKITGIRTETEGREIITHSIPATFMTNHQSGLDLFTFGQFWPPRAIAVGKKELMYIPIVGQIMWISGMQFLDRKKTKKAIGQLKHLRDTVRKNGLSVGIAPEGTRNLSGKGLLPFKKGAFHLAIGIQLPIVPMVCSPVTPLFSLKDRRIRPGILRIKVFDPIPTQGLGSDDVVPLRDQVYDVMANHVPTMETVVL